MSEGREFEDFLAAARAEHGREAAPDYGERVAASLGEQLSWRRRLSAGAAAGLAALTTKVPASSVHETPASWIKKAIAVGVPIAGLSLIGYAASIEPSPAPARAPASVVSAPSSSSPLPSSSPLLEVPPAVDTASALVAAADLPDARTERVSRSSTAPRAKDEGSLEAELALLRQVTGALQTNQPARALSLEDEHARRFPGGLLVPEFAGQRVLTLAALGRHAEACEQSRAFLSKYPKSPLASQVRASCDSR